MIYKIKILFLLFTCSINSRLMVSNIYYLNFRILDQYAYYIIFIY